jgi:hypothetical protein
MNRLDDVLFARARTRYNVNPTFQTRSAHSNRFDNSVLSVNNEFLRQAVNNLPAGRKLHRTGGFDGAFNIFGGNFALIACYRDHTTFIFTAQMFARKIDRRRMNFQTADALGFSDGFFD